MHPRGKKGRTRWFLQRLVMIRARNAFRLSTLACSSFALSNLTHHQLLTPTQPHQMLKIFLPQAAAGHTDYSPRPWSIRTKDKSYISPRRQSREREQQEQRYQQDVRKEIDWSLISKQLLQSNRRPPSHWRRFSSFRSTWILALKSLRSLNPESKQKGKERKDFSDFLHHNTIQKETKGSPPTGWLKAAPKFVDYSRRRWETKTSLSKNAMFAKGKQQLWASKTTGTPRSMIWRKRD